MTWSTHHELYLKKIAERCVSREVMHLMSHRILSTLSVCFKLPTIFLTLIGGSAQASQDSLDKLIDSPSFTPWLPIILGMISLFVSLLNSVSSFLQIESLTQQHLSSSISFGKLHRLISRDIGISPTDRTLTGCQAVKTYCDQFDNLLEQSPPLSRSVEKKFSQRRCVKKLKLNVPPSIKIDGIDMYQSGSTVEQLTTLCKTQLDQTSTESPTSSEDV